MGINANISPKNQHEAEAKRILARRGLAEAKKDEPIKRVEPIKGGASNGADTAGKSEYEGLSVKELRAECEGRGIKTKKKDTIAVLIGKLEG